MTTKAAFSPEEWEVVLEGPPAAGLMVITAAHGGTFRETIAMSKAYAETRAEHGDSELLDEIVSAKPKVDHTRYHSPEELRDAGLGHLRDAMALLGSKATAAERDDYRRFVISLANKSRDRPAPVRSLLLPLSSVLVPCYSLELPANRLTTPDRVSDHRPARSRPRASQLSLRMRGAVVALCRPRWRLNRLALVAPALSTAATVRPPLRAAGRALIEQTRTQVRPASRC